jgi:HD-GYP domain-containing protein (c-di-GMP phosphodiesterase class II)
MKRNRATAKNFYANVIIREKNLQKLRCTTGSRKPVTEKETRVTKLISAIKHTAPHKNNHFNENFSRKKPFSTTAKENAAKKRLNILSIFSIATKFPLRIVPERLLRKLAFKSIDKLTESHIKQVERFAQAIYDNLTPEQKNALGVSRTETGQAAKLHDEGKLLIPSYFFRKHGPLSPEEITEIQKHPDYSHELLLKMGYRERIANSARQHHMDYDGKGGYPQLKSGEKIDPLSSLIKVADVAQTMFSGRIDGTRKNPRGILQELKEYTGKQFDPIYVNALENAFKNDQRFTSWLKKANKQNTNLKKRTENTNQNFHEGTGQNDLR